MRKKIKSTLFKWNFLLLVGVLFACTNKDQVLESLDFGEIKPINVGKDLEIIYSTKGNVVFQLNTPLLNKYLTEDVEYSEMPKGVEVKIFDTAMRVTTKLTSNYAIDSTLVDKMEAKGDVVVINDKGEKLNTEHLVWNKKTEEITSDVKVIITTADQILKGEGLISNQDFSEYRILKPTGTFNIDND